MKQLYILVLFFLIFNTANARVKIPVCFPCETLEIVQQLPVTSEIQELAGEKVNIAYINNEYGILWLSVWNANGRFVLSNTSQTVYYEIDEEITKILKEKHNFDSSNQSSPLSFWKVYFGKIIVFILFAIVIWSYIPYKPKEEVKEEAKE